MKGPAGKNAKPQFSYSSKRGSRQSSGEIKGKAGESLGTEGDINTPVH